MLLIYIAITFMLALALALLSIPFIKNNSLFSKSFFATAILAGVITTCLYQYDNHNAALLQWLSRGKAHYDLLVQFNAMGGIDGMIKQIKAKIEKNPADPQGWFILGKLYLSKQDFPAAKLAFTNAHELKPEDQQINFYSELAARSGS